MRIDRITVKNFRNFEQDTTFDLNPNFTAVIGINGKGKSSILHAVRIAAGSYLLGIPEAGKRHIYESEIRLKDFGTHTALQTPTIVRAEGSIDGRKLSRPWQRRIAEGKTKTTSSSEDVGEIRALAREKYELSTKQGMADVDNPVIAYFGTGRLYGGSRNTLGPFISRQIYKYGYYSWMEMQYATYQYVNWLGSHRFLVADRKESPATYEAFMAAVKTANPYITAIDFDGIELRLKVKLHGDGNESQYLPLSLHSDGVITHTAMVAELAYRCIVLNAHHGENAVKRSRGVVMIDEVDLHLHPSWQRHVVKDLKLAFPEIQFVVTTHSPFIVQSLESSELINLDKDTDITPSELTLEEISTEVMGIESELSVKSSRDEELSNSYLEKLKSLGDKDTARIVSELDDIELHISDPAVRAFLKMKRLEKKGK